MISLANIFIMENPNQDYLRALNFYLCTHFQILRNTFIRLLEAKRVRRSDLLEGALEHGDDQKMMDSVTRDR